MQRNRTKQKAQHTSNHNHAIIKKNEKENITAYALSTDGKAIGRGEDQIVVFVPNLLPGEKAKVEVIKKKANYKIATLAKLETSAPYRTTPPCQYNEHCGGCQLQHISPEFQSEFKLQWLFETLKRIGKWEVRHISEAERKIEIVYLRREHYRRRVRLHFDGKHLGFKQNSSNKVTDIKHCYISANKINQKIEFIRVNLLKIVTELNHKSWECEIEVTVSDDEKVILHIADLTINDKNLNKTDLLKALEKYLNIVSDQNISLKHPDLPKFKIKKQSFVQPHLDCIQYYYKYLYQNISAFIQKNKESITNFKAIDLYAGAGIFTGIPYFAGKPHKIEIDCLGVEGVPEAIDSLNNNYKNYPVRGITQDVDQFIEQQFQLKLQDPDNYSDFHILILDPPRAGCTIANMQKIVEICAKNTLVLYLACDPASFARDSRVLLEGGFKLTSLTLFDSFGHTTHYETLGCFEKK